MNLRRAKTAPYQNRLPIRPEGLSKSLPSAEDPAVIILPSPMK